MGKTPREVFLGNIKTFFSYQFIHFLPSRATDLVSLMGEWTTYKKSKLFRNLLLSSFLLQNFMPYTCSQRIVFISLRVY